MSELRFSLDLIEVASPCTVPWDSMSGRGRIRHCGQCRQNVYSLSEMSKEEAVSLLRRTEGKLCVRVYRRPDGTVVTRDCAAVRWSRAVWSAGAFVAFGLLSVLAAVSVPWAARAYERWGQEQKRNTVQGKLCIDPTWNQQAGPSPPALR